MASPVGYITNFIGKDLVVNLPKLSAGQKKDLALIDGSPSGEIQFPHFSVFLSKSRKFPIFTATNINGGLFKPITRKSIFPGGKDVWKVDLRAKDFQWEDDLYIKAKKSDFDRGHMTKREDPQWGTKTEAFNAAKSTFHYCNCAPQLADLNQKEWKLLEDYILDKESVPDKLFINVFTGPVLRPEDPIFVTRVNDTDVLLPTLFWKVIYYTNDGKKLNKVGFLMGQDGLLKKRGIVRPQAAPAPPFAKLASTAKEHFNEFQDAQTYQVSMATIEQLTGIKFPSAKEPYKDPRPVPLVIKMVDLKEDAPQAVSGSGARPLHGSNYRYSGIVLR
ncbi:MAG TPA: DNA/RNA non-specific endonuclease [Ferruginibacter sp.]|nr:DNA/RNA non-specific endonuclease [Ferruginibacter sp.]